MEWIETITSFLSEANWWVKGGILTTIFVLVGLYSTRLLTWLMVAALIVAYQDYWIWLEEPERSYFELPSGFVYHVGLSVVTAVVWWIVTMEAWPEDDTEQDFDSELSDAANDHVGGAA